MPPLVGDCDDADPGAWRSAQAWRDADGDGVGEGDPVALCIGDRLPAGWAAKGGDCAPGDGTRWQLLAYAGVDRDGDGHTVAQAGTVCAGAGLPEPYRATVSGDDDCDDADRIRWRRVAVWADEDGDHVGAGPRLDRCVGAALPAGYTTVASGDDCNDRDPLAWTRVFGHADADLDGVGAGDAVTACTSGALPAGFVARGGDCAPGDRARWRLVAYAGVDRDGDGYTVAERGEVCVGEVLPDPYRATLVGNDCADGDENRYRWVVLYRDGDGDGVGAGPRTIECLGSEFPAGSSIFGFDADDADSTIRVRDDVAAELLLDL